MKQQINNYTTNEKVDVGKGTERLWVTRRKEVGRDSRKTCWWVGDSVDVERENGTHCSGVIVA